MPGPLIDPPVCIPPRGGLFSVAEVVDVPDGHWQLEGFEHELLPCVNQVLSLAEGCTPTPENKADSIVRR